MFDTDMITWIWLIAGIILLLSEFIVPGLVVAFFGVGAIIVALCRWIGIIESWQMSFLTWISTSSVLVFTLRNVIKKLYPSDTSYQSIEEDVNAFGKIVEVAETVNDKDDTGRIRYQGTTWPAMTEKGIIAKGKKAKLTFRNNIAWIVEPYFDADEDV